MKARFLIAAMMAVCVAACSDNDADEPTGPDVPPMPPTEQIEPLTDELRPILTEGKRWYVEAGMVSMIYNTDIPAEYIPGNVTYTCTVGEDVTAKGLPAKKISVLNNETGNYWSDNPVPEAFYVVNRNLKTPIMREENGVVYNLCHVGDHGAPADEIDPFDKFVVSCNIVPDQSETYPCYTYGTTIISRGTIVLQGKTRRAVKVWSDGWFFIDFPVADPYDYWVEGIGSLFGQMPYEAGMYPSQPPFMYMDRYRLLECYDGDEKIYDYREFTPELYTEEEVFTDIDRQQ